MLQQFRTLCHALQLLIRRIVSRVERQPGAQCVAKIALPCLQQPLRGLYVLHRKTLRALTDTQTKIGSGKEIADSLCTFAEAQDSSLAANALEIDKRITIAQRLALAVMEERECRRYFADYCPAKKRYLPLRQFVLKTNS